MGLKTLPVKSPPKPPQAGRNPARNKTQKEEKKRFEVNPREEDGTGRRQQNQTGGFTPYSD
jgi:hypothetical protein